MKTITLKVVAILCPMVLVFAVPEADAHYKRRRWIKPDPVHSRSEASTRGQEITEVTTDANATVTEPTEELRKITEEVNRIARHERRRALARDYWRLKRELAKAKEIIDQKKPEIEEKVKEAKEAVDNGEKAVAKTREKANKKWDEVVEHQNRAEELVTRAQQNPRDPQIQQDLLQVNQLLERLTQEAKELDAAQATLEQEVNKNKEILNHTYQKQGEFEQQAREVEESKKSTEEFLAAVQPVETDEKSTPVNSEGSAPGSPAAGGGGGGAPAGGAPAGGQQAGAPAGGGDPMAGMPFSGMGGMNGQDNNLSNSFMSTPQLSPSQLLSDKDKKAALCATNPRAQGCGNTGPTEYYEPVGKAGGGSASTNEGSSGAPMVNQNNYGRYNDGSESSASKNAALPAPPQSGGQGTPGMPSDQAGLPGASHSARGYAPGPANSNGADTIAGYYSGSAGAKAGAVIGSKVGLPPPPPSRNRVRGNFPRPIAQAMLERYRQGMRVPAATAALQQAGIAGPHDSMFRKIRNRYNTINPPLTPVLDQ